MQSFSTDQKIAMLVLPVLLFGVLGVGYASADVRRLSEQENDSATEIDQCDDMMTEKTQLNRSSRNGANERQIAIRDAVASNDFEAFKKATVGTPFGEEITKELFSVLVQTHTLHQAGDYSGAQNLMQTAGLRSGGMMGGRMSASY